MLHIINIEIKYFFFADWISTINKQRRISKKFSLKDLQVNYLYTVQDDSLF